MRSRFNYSRLAVLTLSGVVGVAATVHAQSTTPDCSAQPYNVPPGFPTASTTAAQDQAHLMCLQGLQFPTTSSNPPLTTNRSTDPNRPPNAWPTNLTTPETSNWTDALSHTIVRWGWGQWTTYDDSDSGGQAQVLCNGAANCTVAAQKGSSTGGAYNGIFGDFGPAGTRPYPTGSALLGDYNATVCTSPGCQAPYTYTPIDMFTTENGATTVTTPKDWWTRRRPELLNLVQKELYGYMWTPDRWPSITWTISAVSTGTQAGTVGCTTSSTVNPSPTCPTGTMPDGNTYSYRQKTYTGILSAANYPVDAPPLRNAPVIIMNCRFPASAQGKVPTIIAIGGSTSATGHPFQYTAPLGFGACSYAQTSLQADAGGAATSSYLTGLINGGNWRQPTDPGTLEAWAWGISRTIDEFALDPDPIGPDADKIGVEGHSRNGKATLVTAALDDRVVAALPSCGGAGGTAMIRRNFGESIESIVGSGEYYWMDGYLMNYAGARCQTNPDRGPAGCTPAYMPRAVEDLDVDAPQVMALIAPRAVMTNGGTDTPAGNGDAWQDPRSMFLTGQLAGPVWQLLGWPGQVIPQGTPFTSNPTPFNSGESIGGTPPFNVEFISGTVGYRRHSQGHTDVPEWPVFVRFASKYFNDVRPVIAPNQNFTLPASDTTVGTVHGTGGGGGPITNWQIKGGTGADVFSIDPSTGTISIPDRSKLNGGSSYTLTLMASDTILPTHDTTVAINAAPVVSGNVQLITSTSLLKQGDGSYQATVTVANTGTGTAQNVVLTGVAIGSSSGTPVPQTLISIPPSGFAITSVSFPASTGASGTRVLEKVTGTYTGGTFGGTLRATLP